MNYEALSTEIFESGYEMNQEYEAGVFDSNERDKRAAKHVLNQMHKASEALHNLAQAVKFQELSDSRDDAIITTPTGRVLAQDFLARALNRNA